MVKRKTSSSESTSSSSNKKRHVDDDAILTNARYEELFKYYCKSWIQINAPSGGGILLRRRHQPPRMSLMKRVYKEMMKADKKRDKTDAKNILYRFDKWYESGAQYPLQRPRDWFQKLLTGVDNDNVDCDDAVNEVINLADEPDESNTIDMETWVLECIMLDVVKAEGGDDGSNNLAIKSEVDGDGEDEELGVEHDSPLWEKYFKALKEFKEKNGKHKWPSKLYKQTIIYEDGKKETINLGEWCTRQRQAKKRNGRGKITEEQIRRLNNIGFIWDSITLKWEKHFKALKQFKEKNGKHQWLSNNYTHTITYEDGKKETIHLGNWCDNQRQAKKGNGGCKITEKQIRRLNTIGFIWYRTTFIWEKNFKALKEFKEKNSKHQWPSRNYKHTIIYEDGKKETIKLGKWCHTQRQAKKGNGLGKLTEKQIRRLNNTGFVWDLITFVWEKNFKALKEFKEKYGKHQWPSRNYKHTIIYEDEKKETIKLGIWCNKQRQAKKPNGRGKITEEQIHRLNNIGFIWDPITFVWEKNFKVWKKYFKALKEFKEKNGKHQWPSQLYKHTIIYEDGKKETINLGIWCNKQRQAKKRSKDMQKNGYGKLTEEQICRLNTIGFIWDPNTFVWEKYFKALKEFKEKNGKHKWPSRNYKHTIIYEDGKEETINLGIWCNKQRQAKKPNGRCKLTEEQIRRLNSIDFIWEPSARVTQKSRSSIRL